MDELENLSFEESAYTELSDTQLRELEEEFTETGPGEADQPLPGETPGEDWETADQQPPQETAEEEAQSEEERFALKHLGETREVDRDEVIALAQKGMDYDRIRGRSAEMEDFIRELAKGENMEAAAFMDETRARRMAAREGIALDQARQRVQAGRQERTRQQDMLEKERAAAATQADILAFMRRNKDVDVNSIPREVWQAVNTGSSLTDAWTQHENRLLKGKLRDLEAQMEAGARGQRDRDRSTGSQRSAGKGKTDPIDAWWYEDD